jgi:predicted nucleotidyltransferase
MGITRAPAETRTPTGRALRGRPLQVRQAHLMPAERGSPMAFVDRLRQRYGDDLLRVVLFGSKVRWDLDDETDFDLRVVARAMDWWRCWREVGALE